MLAYLARKRGRPVTRDELIDLLWPSDPPAHPDEVLGSLLSKLRRALGPGMVAGRHDLTLVLPEGERVDVEIVEDAIERAEAALAGGGAGLAFAQAQRACELTEGGFLPGFDSPWVEERRREVEDLRIRALGCLAGAGLANGGAQLGPGERAARELISVAPLSELGYRLLMEILAKRGDVAAALQTYDSLRVQLRDELGIAPAPAIRALHERLLAGGDEAETPSTDRNQPPPAAQREERKLVSVLVAAPDPELPDDPEDRRIATAKLLGHVRQEVERFGGTVEHRADGVALALFGAPVAHEDDAERAVRAALRLRELGLAARVGVATGEVLVAPHAPPGATTGRAIDEAVAMERAAPRGGVAADELTIRAIPPDAVVYRALAHGSWVVDAVSDRLTAPLEHPARTRFIGRENELGLLEGLYRGVVEHGQPSMVVILGHAGVGKSRLVDEFLKQIGRSAPSVYRGRCLSYGEGTTYWALREVLWAAAGIRFDDPATLAAHKLRDRVRGVVAPAEAERVTAALALASGIRLPDNPLERLSPASVADEVALAWPGFLTGLATLAPVAVVIEDLHWAEEPLLEMVERMVARSTGPLLLVGTARPELAEARAGWSTRPGISQISLEPLSQAASRELISELLPQADPGVCERLLATAEGNPFFAEELARHVSGYEGNAAEIPNTVRAVLAARIDALPEAEKHTLQDAAVVGRAFWATTLEAIEPRPALRETLGVLEQRALVVTRPASSLPEQLELSFRHGLTREVAYRSIPRARRCRAHAAVGRWIEQLAGDRRAEFIDLLAHHYEAAAAPGDAALAWPQGSLEPEQLRGKAFSALIEAGHAARQRLSTEQAVRFAQRAQVLAATDRERLAAVELEARTQHAAVRSDEALAAYLAGIELARTLGDRDTLSRLRAYAILLCVRYAGAFTGDSWRPRAFELIEAEFATDESGRETLERGAVMLGRSWGRHRWAEADKPQLAVAKREAVQAVAIAKTTDSPELLGAALEGLTWLVLEEGFCEARKMGQRLKRASTRSTDPVDAHESMVTAAICFVLAGQFDPAVKAARRAATEAPRLSPHRALHSAMAQTYCLVPTGRLAELGEGTNRVLELAREDASNTRTCLAAVLAIAGRALWLHESLQQEAAASALELMNSVRPPPRRSIYEYFMAELLRPVIGIESTRRVLESLPPPRHDAATEILYLRAQLPVLALDGAKNELEIAIARAHELSRSACAPALSWIADWAAAAGTATEDPAASLQHALGATSALTEYGETYTAKRLLSDFLPLVKGRARGELAEEAAQQLQEMGALASAASTRSLVIGI